jgi:hypothetical protein
MTARSKQIRVNMKYNWIHGILLLIASSTSFACGTDLPPPFEVELIGEAL